MVMSGQFELLFRSSYVSLVRYAKTLIKDHDTAEEIVQDLFFRLWQDREKIKIESSLNGYLFRSVHNTCLHYLEHNKVVERHAEEMFTTSNRRFRIALRIFSIIRNFRKE